MHRSFVAIGLVAATASWAASPALAGRNQDVDAIRQVQARQADAWNKHDAPAFANLFTEDGDVVNVVGWWWKGRGEIARKLTVAFVFVFKDSTLTITETDMRFLTPTIAIAHVSWTMVGAKTPPGMPEPRQGIEVQVLEKRAGKWLIASFQNTLSIPERPFPEGPPHPAGTKP